MSRLHHRSLGQILVVSLAVFFASAVSPLAAQDTRAVKEPVIPQACTTLKASLTSAFASSGQVEARADKAGSDHEGLDTTRIQQALDHCPKGTAVELASNAANNAFITGPIALRPGVTLLVDKGVTLYASRNPEAYAITPGSCGLVNDASTGCKPLITVKLATGAAIMGDGVIDGQGGSRMFLNGELSPKSWWDLADQAHTAGHQQSPRMIDADLTDDFTLYRITLRNSPNLHVAVHRSDGFTVWGVKIDTPKSARNTDGIDTTQSKNITITQSFLRTGEDNIAIKASDGPTTNVTIAHNHFYWGHGLTIGNETNGGVSQIRVQDLSLDGPDNGLRIKSSPGHGGLVEDVVYDDVCIRDSKSPIVFDTAYSFPGKGVEQFPVYQDITLHNIRITGGGKIQFNGFDNTHRIAVTLDGVLVQDDPDRYRAQAIHTSVAFGPGPVNLVFTGDDATATGKEVKGSLPGCNTKFVPFP
jgi:polygalacturonase